MKTETFEFISKVFSFRANGAVLVREIVKGKWEMLILADAEEFAQQNARRDLLLVRRGRCERVPVLTTAAWRNRNTELIFH